MKNQTKNYKGYTFRFERQFNGNYKVSAEGFGSYWYQSTASVRDAFRKIKSL